MFKKLLSAVSAIAMLAMLMPIEAIALSPNSINDIMFSVGGSQQDHFSPSTGEELEIRVSYNTLDYKTPLASALGTVKINNTDGTELESYDIGSVTNSLVAYGPWDGLDDAGVAYPDGSYEVEVSLTITDGTEIKTASFNIGNTPTTTATLSVTDSTLDFAEDGDNEELEVAYEVTGDFNTLTFIIYNSRSEIVKTYTPTNPQASSTALKIWNGDNLSGDLSDPGTYTLELSIATDLGVVTTDPVIFEVAYDSSDKPNIKDGDVDPSTFDPDDETVDITFSHDGDVDGDTEADVWVEIQETDGTVVRTFSDYNGDSIDSNDEQTIEWDGDRNSGSQVPNGNYKVYIRTENSAGVDVEYLDVEVDDDGVNVPSSNSHISGIDLDPSSTYEPADDDDLIIEFDVKKDLDELKIYAVKGSDKIEIEDTDDVDKENNLEVTWDGTDDDDEYVDEGTWKIRFETSVGSTDLIAEKSIKLKFDEPKITDFELSKDEIDTDIGESTYIIFRTDEDAEVDILVYEDGDEEDEIEEDLEVEGDKWYAIEWDGDSYDSDDDDKDIEIKLVAKTIGGKASDSEKRDIDFKEDDVSSSKSNITNDYISPAIADSGDDMSIFYELEDDADVTITIHKGTSSSGKLQIELVDDVDQDADDYEIKWDGEDDDNKKLKDGFYTYKIISKDKSKETETGIFAIGDIGDDDGSSSSSSDDGDVSSNVKIVSGDNNSGDDDSSTCGGYNDVSGYSDNCEAIDWVTSSGIFQGYADDTFKPYQAINRVEVLKVLMEGLGMSILPADYTNLGFIDVDAYAWYMPYIKTAKMAGIFQGDGGANTARPGGTINRAELLKLAFETLKIATGYNVASCSSSYTDVPANAWYKNYACAAKNYGIFNSTILNAGKLSTRGEVAQMLYDLHLAGLI